MPRLSTRNLILAGSMAANLVLLGFVVGAGVRLAGPGPSAPPPEAFEGASPRSLLFGLDREQRVRIRDEMIREGQRSAPLFRELGEARRDMEAAVLAEPFDIEGARAALARQRDIGRQLEARSDDLILRIVSDLTPEQRARAVEARRERAERFQDRGRDGDGRDRRDGPENGPGNASENGPESGFGPSAPGEPAAPAQPQR